MAPQKAKPGHIETVRIFQLVFQRNQIEFLKYQQVHIHLSCKQEQSEEALLEPSAHYGNILST